MVNVANLLRLLFSPKRANRILAAEIAAANGYAEPLYRHLSRAAERLQKVAAKFRNKNKETQKRFFDMMQWYGIAAVTISGYLPREYITRDRKIIIKVMNTTFKYLSFQNRQTPRDICELAEELETYKHDFLLNTH